MFWLFFTIAILVVIIILMAYFFSKKLKKFRDSKQLEIQNISNQFYFDIQNIANQSQLEIQCINDSHEEYKKQVLKNLNEVIPYGEILLIEEFRKIFANSSFHDFTIYNALSFKKSESFFQADFLVVSPKGVFVIESKRWGGITYIYSDDYKTMFSDTYLKNFGVGKTTGIRVINAKISENDNKEVILKTYNNPLQQARQYSQILLKELNVKPIKNIVTFYTGEKYVVLFNDEKIENVKIDKYTNIISDKNILEYFDSQLVNEKFDHVKMNKYIKDNFSFRLVLDENNFNQAPFCLIQ